MSVDAVTVTHWRSTYSQKYHVPQGVLASFGDDIAHAMKGLVASGRSPGDAYKIITNGLYAEARAIAANRGRKRTSRRNAMTTLDLGNNESISAGISGPHSDGRFLALAYTQSKWFRTRGGAERWLAKRGYGPDGKRLSARNRRTSRRKRSSR